VVRTAWYQALRGFFERYDYFVLPSAQVFRSMRDRLAEGDRGHTMDTYHRWMEVMIPATCRAVRAVRARGLQRARLPMGLQIVAPNHSDLACLQLAHAYDQATAGSPSDRRRCCNAARLSPSHHLPASRNARTAFTVASGCSSISQWPASLITAGCTSLAPARITSAMVSPKTFHRRPQARHGELGTFEEFFVVDRILIERGELAKPARIAPGAHRAWQNAGAPPR